MDWLSWFMIVAWGLIFIITLIVELSTTDLTTIWFCVASAISLVCAGFNMNPLLQIAIFVVVSLVLVFATRPLTKNMMNKDIIRTNSDKVINKVGVVTIDIVDGEVGEIKVSNEIWRAISADNSDIHVGEKVEVTAVSGNKAVVSRVEKPSNIEFI